MKNLNLYTDMLHSPLFSHGPIVVFIWENSKSWPIIDVSSNIEKIYGYEVEMYTNGKLTFTDHIHPDDISRVHDEVTHANNEGATSFEHKPYRYLSLDGSYHWVSDNTTILRDDDGTILYYVGYLTNISEYVENNEKLLEENAWYKKLFELSPVGMANNKMSDGTFVELNSALHDMCGYTKEEFLNLSYWDITPKEYEEDEEKQLQSLQEKGKYGPYQKEYIHKDGYTFPVLLNGIKHTNKKGEAYIWSIVQDVSKFVDIYKDIASQELKFRSIFEHANDGISIIQNGVFTQANQKVADILNTTLENIINKSPDDLSPKYQADGELSSLKAQRIVQNVLKGETNKFDWLHQNPKGEIFPVEISLSFVENGEDSFVLCLWRDISERVATLEALQKEKERADNANLLKSRFLANMSHEIRTPMNGILGFVDILAKDENDAKRKELFNYIKESGKTLLSIINDILDISKIESGKLIIENVEFETEELFDNLSLLYKTICHDKNITFIYEKEDQLPNFLIGDYVRIKQIILNFLSNAVKFTQEDGTIALRIAFNTTKKYLRCSVEDSGTGIHKENLHKIFNDFEQEDISTTRKFGGTGLGLSISSKLTALMNGSINVTSELGYGSTFSFEIPLEIANSEHTTLVPSVSENEVKLFHAHVLIVEDNKTNQLLLSMFLEEFGISFDIANDGVESISAVNEHSYDMIFMDENMPNMNGIEATKIIRTEVSNNQETPIIAVTANALTGDRERFLAAGMNEYISKPYDEDDIKNVLNKFLLK